MKRYLEAGQIVSTQGIKGEVRVKPWTDSPEFLCEFDVLYYDNGKIAVEIEKARPHGNIVVMKIKGIDDTNSAQALRNKVLYMDRDDIELDDGVFFIQDLIGLKVIDADNNDVSYGEIIDVTQTGANDVYHIKDDQGKVVLVPAIKDVVIDTNLENSMMVIRPLKGLFDDED